MAGYKKKKSGLRPREEIKETLRIYTCLNFGTKPPKSSHICKTYHPIFLCLLSLSDFSTDFPNFAEALFAY